MIHSGRGARYFISHLVGCLIVELGTLVPLEADARFTVTEPIPVVTVEGSPSVDLVCCYSPLTASLTSVKWFKHKPDEVQVYDRLVFIPPGNAINDLTGRASDTIQNGCASLTIYNITSCDASRYTCTITDSSTALTKNVTLTVKNDFEILIKHSADISKPLTDGQIVTMTCLVANGAPRPVLTWKKQDEMGNDITQMEIWEKTTNYTVSDESAECHYNGSISLNINVPSAVQVSKVKYLCLVNGVSSIAGTTPLITYPAQSPCPGWCIAVTCVVISLCIIAAVTLYCLYKKGILRCGGCCCEGKPKQSNLGKHHPVGNRDL